MLPVSLDCPFLIAPSVFSNVYLFCFPSYCTQDTGRRQTKQINIRENRRGNQEWTIQRNWQHWVHKIRDEDKQNKNTTQKNKKMNNTDLVYWCLTALSTIFQLHCGDLLYWWQKTAYLEKTTDMRNFINKYLKWQWIFYFLRRFFIFTAKIFTGLNCIYE
jgi:hypothetical protein